VLFPTGGSDVEPVPELLTIFSDDGDDAMDGPLLVYPLPQPGGSCSWTWNSGLHLPHVVCIFFFLQVEV
jgi:hypothetical protein